MDGSDENERMIGAVCLALAGTESMMDAIIVNQYAPNQPKAWEFTSEVLADEAFSFALRCNVLQKVLVRRGRAEKQAAADMQSLRMLGNLRNLIAHSGKLAVSRTGAGSMHPKKPGEVIDDADLVELCARFNTVKAEVQDMLLKEIEKISVEKFGPGGPA